jgi:hypothetical protein
MSVYRSGGSGGSKPTPVIKALIGTNEKVLFTIR